MSETFMGGVEEYAEGREVVLCETDGWYAGDGLVQRGAGRLVVKARNEGGYSCTEVDLLQLIAWLHANRPELLLTSPNIQS